MEQWIRIDTGYACACVRADNGVVVETAPIFNWMRGKPLEKVLAWNKIKKWEYLPPGTKRHVSEQTVDEWLADESK